MRIFEEHCDSMSCPAFRNGHNAIKLSKDLVKVQIRKVTQEARRELIR